jgi:cytidine deaminase
VAAGLKRLVYLEPYPKSYANSLHGDSIAVNGEQTDNKVRFDPFKGVAPYRYRDLFEKGKRKVSGGAAQQWDQGQRHPMIEVYYPSYFQAEIIIVSKLKEEVESINAESKGPAA